MKRNKFVKCLRVASLLILLGCQQPRNPEMRLPMSLNKHAGDVKEGKHVKYDSMSNVHSILEYKNGKLNGECVWFYPNGKIKNKINYENGLENGMAYYFYPTGVIECFRRWEMGKKVGYAVDYYDTIGITKAALEYNEDGDLVKRMTFDTLGRLIKTEGER
jgi:antitoxin component YwqK of YwqJK toxin-antitoxin module